ncbi:hypothetical protein EVJ58_g6233 [Rhodofomes roseus]|uniref:Integrase catalytic domain-containing protein n=1 Tax=Rhodofomes roseus TaxID=34475 RepID=A0A4Y9Y872_9APHY|nr:hypothetical protein EVJ58_g6233 [Rhodofomes roseus]
MLHESRSFGPLKYGHVAVESVTLVLHDKEGRDAAWCAATGSLGGDAVTAVSLSVTTNAGLLERVRAWYTSDKWCAKLKGMVGSLGVAEHNGLLFLADRLIVPKIPDVRKSLYRLAHDALGHFGFDKSYATLREAYYWPNMRRDFEDMYIPLCKECQRNKSSTRKAPGSLHPLPVPDGCGEEVTIDFIGPLPLDEGYDCLATVTDRMGSDLQLILTTMDVNEEQFVSQYFDAWYCNNGLSKVVTSNRDKIFTSKFWQTLQRLAGVKWKMSMSFHPQTDGASERSNKTVIQALRYHVGPNQKGWVRALPRVRFAIMNTVNVSTGFSPFQLLQGHLPRVIPPLLDDDIRAACDDASVACAAADVIRNIETDIMEAQDNLFLAKVHQALMANAHCGAQIAYAVGDRVMLSMFHRRRKYMQRGNHRVAKFMVCWDGPYKVLHAHLEFLVYTLDLPSHMQIFPTFHASLLKPFHNNNSMLFPSREYAQPGPVVTPDGEEEFDVKAVTDRRRHGRGWQYFVTWKGYPKSAGSWLPGKECENLAALDTFLASVDDP